MAKKSKNPILEIIKIGAGEFSRLSIKDSILGETVDYEVIRIEKNDLVILKVEGNGRFSGTHRDGIIDIRKLKKKRKK